MKITRISTLTGMKHTLEVPCTPEELEAYTAGVPIQFDMPTVSPEWREYIISGITPDEWDKFITEELETYYSINPLNHLLCVTY